MRSVNNTQTAADIKELRAEVKRLGAMVRDTAEHAKEDAGAIAGNVIGFDRKELRKMARKAGKNVRGFISDKRHQAEELRDTAEERITTHPFRAVAASLASGLVIGALLRRF